MRRYSKTVLLVAAFNCSLRLAAIGDDTTAVKEVAIDGPASVAIQGSHGGSIRRGVPARSNW